MRRLIVVMMLSWLLAASDRASGDTLDDFLASPQLVKTVNQIGLLILSQADPKVAAHDAGELRKNFWATRREARLTDAEADLALNNFDHDWESVATVVRERQLSTIKFVGVDLVFLKQSMDWYYGVTTPRGPVLIRVSVQYNDNAPMSIHGVKVWADWHEVKAVSRAIQLPAASKVLNITADRASPPPER